MHPPLWRRATGVARRPGRSGKPATPPAPGAPRQSSRRSRRRSAAAQVWQSACIPASLRLDDGARPCGRWRRRHPLAIACAEPRARAPHRTPPRQRDRILAQQCGHARRPHDEAASASWTRPSARPAGQAWVQGWRERDAGPIEYCTPSLCASRWAPTRAVCPRFHSRVAHAGPQRCDRECTQGRKLRATTRVRRVGQRTQRQSPPCTLE
jgi:hypothetical protein